MSHLEIIRSRLASYTPQLVEARGRGRAAVAVVLREVEAGSELLFIERATREGDPWSGHMAFPGGRLESADPSEEAAAARETLEEVGLSLKGASVLGRLDDLEGRPDGGIVVSAHVFLVEAPQPLVLNPEVADAFWFPVAALSESDRQVDYPHATYGGKKLPGVLVGDPDRHIVWGLTYRFLDVLLGIAGTPLPNRWTDLR